VALVPGTRLGPYEIIAVLGAGGMGEVYKARDTRLDRIVGIKILPEALAADPEFRQRFDREARTISQLEHPHICALYDVGEQDGTAFLVMQHLEGETLADRLRKGILPLDQVLQYAIQIADALDRAHRAGIVHRDLKPGNVMITKGGARLLDFGLAKTNPHTVAGAGLSMLPTTPPHLTAQGTLLGTFQYMAPEQLEGQEADARSDVFAFGAVVYEMTTGKKAFEGKSQASLIASILTAEPPSLSQIQPLTPPALEHVVRVALAKDPDARWQSMRDVHRELTWIADESSRRGVAAAIPATNRRTNVARSWLAGIAVGVAAGIALALWLSPRTRINSASGVTQFSILLKAGLRMPDVSTVALSPDGRTAVIAADDGTGAQLYVRPLDRLQLAPLNGTAGAIAPFFSPDGQWVGFWLRGRLQKVAVGGGAPQEICDAPEPHPAVWSDDGTIYFTPTDGAGLSQVSGDGGATRAITTASRENGEKTHRPSDVLPGGKVVLMTVGTGSIDTYDDARIEALIVATGQRKILIRGGMNARYVPSGHLIYARAGALLAVRFDLDRVAVTGSPATVASDVVTNAVSGFGNFAVSRDGSLLYATGAPTTYRYALVWVDRQGRSELADDSPSTAYRLRLSPDGQRVALEMNAANNSVWVRDLASARNIRLTSEWDNSAPTWSSDGARLTFNSNRATPGAYDLVQQNADGTGAAERLAVDTSTFQWPDAWSPDGRFLVFTRRRAGAGPALWIWSSEERTARPFTESSLGAQISPDGHWLAYQSMQSGRPEVYVQAFPGPARKWPISSDGGNFPIWSRDGRELFYRSGEWMMAVPITTTPEFSAGRAVRLFSGAYLSGLSSYDVARDGRFLMFKREEQPPVTQVNVVLNWSDELKSRIR
jgi:serine/threonine-protein kinase